ncbi:MAG: ATP-binding protein [Rhodospirillales bacterium]|nr:ATP-binding protein [Rhodospirillales bacterium]
MRGLEIPQTEVLRRFADDNPWWAAGNGIDPERQAWPRRAYYAPFAYLVGNLEVVRAVVLIGPRRVGKTVMIHHTIQGLLDRGVVGTQISYMSLDTPLYSGRALESLVRMFIDQHGHRGDRPLWVFFDEVQYLKDWEVHLKSLVDTFRWIRFVASGSAAATLKRKSRESGAGRFSDFLLPPLTFAEYLNFIEREQALIVPTGTPPWGYQPANISELNHEFVNYLNYGGFPEAVMNKAVREKRQRFLREDIVEKVLLKDLPSLFGISNTQELNSLFNVLAFNTGQEVRLDNLSKASGVNKQRLLDYLDYLEAAFLIQRVHRIDNTARRMQRATSFKVYLTNPSLRAALFGTIGAEDPAIGHLAETAAWSQWLHNQQPGDLHYARWRSGRSDREVDIVCRDSPSQRPVWATEIKWTNAAIDSWNDLKPIVEFAKQNPMQEPPTVTTLSFAGQKECGGIVLDFVPTSLYCFAVGKNSLGAA